MYQLAKYATATTIYFSMIKAGSNDLAQSADWTPATGDTKVSINGGTLANTTNNPAIVAGTNGVLWSLALTTGELTGADIRVQIVDSATKAVEDQSLCIYTYGNASAKFVCDFSVAALAANVTQYGGTNGTFSGGRPEVNASHIAGSAVSTSTAQIGVNVVNFGGSAGTFASGRPEVNTSHLAGTSLSTSGPIFHLGIVDFGTAQSFDGATDKLRLRSGFSSPDIVGCSVWVYSSTNGLHTRGLVTVWDNTNKDATIDTPVQDPTGTLLYVVFASPKASATMPIASNMTQILGTAVSTPATAGILDVNVKNIDNDAASASGTVTFPNATLASTTNITAGTITTATNVTTVNGLAANTITATSIAADAITAAKIAADAIGASELATDAVTEIVTGVLTSAMTEAYPTDGSTMTVAQALYLIAQSIGEFSVSGTTVTVKKLDGSTTAATYTLDSSTAPTSRTRAT